VYDNVFILLLDLGRFGRINYSFFFFKKKKKIIPFKDLNRVNLHITKTQFTQFIQFSSLRVLLLEN